MPLEWTEREGARIGVRQTIPGAEPDVVWRLWTEPAELARWWPDVAQVDGDARTLHLSWARREWPLRGRILEWEPPHRLAFTWKWDHEPDLPERTVTVDIATLPDGGGTELRLTHGDYGSGDAEAADRQSHVDGWDYFLGRLEGAAGER